MSDRLGAIADVSLPEGLRPAECQRAALPRSPETPNSGGSSATSAALAAPFTFGGHLRRRWIRGNGTGENLTGILNTSGIQSPAFATDLPTTIRKARTALLSLSYGR